MNQNAKLEDTIDDQFHQLGRKTRIIKRLEEDLETMWSKLDMQEQQNRNLESKLRCREEELKWILEQHPAEKESLQEELSKTLVELEQTKKAAAITEAKLKEENYEVKRKLEECEMEKKKLERTIVKQESAMKDLEDEVNEMRKRMKEIIKQNRGLILQLQKGKQLPESLTPSTSTSTSYAPSIPMPQASPPKDIPIQKPSPHYPTHIHRVKVPYVPNSTSPPPLSASSSSTSTSQDSLQPLPQSSSPPMVSPPKTISPPPIRPYQPQLPLKNKY